MNLHNELAGLQGGTSDEYYHLTQSAYNNLYQQDQEVLTTSSPTFAGIKISQSYTPSTASESCTKGNITYDNNYIYVCVATNTWKRAGLNSW